MRRVLFVSPNPGIGGGEVSLLTLIRALDRSRYQPSVAVYGSGAFADEAQSLQCPVHILNSPRGRLRIGTAMELYRILREEQADLLHVNTLDIRAAIAARLARRRLVGHLRVIFPFTQVDHTFARLADAVVCVSRAVRDHFSGSLGASTRGFHVIYNPVDVSASEVPGTELWKELGISPSSRLVGAVGRIDPWKGFETLIEAAACETLTKSDTHIVLCGAPDDSPEQRAYDVHLRTRVTELGLTGRVHFLGHRKDALHILRQLTVLVVPSLILKGPNGIKSEGFGRVAAEGQGVGTPVVVSDAGGLPEIVEDRSTGRSFPPGDSPALAGILDELLSDEEQRERLARAGRIAFEKRFTPRVHTDSITELYDLVLGT